MDITVHASFLPHDDPDASLAFYRDRPDAGFRATRGAMAWVLVPVVLFLLRAGPG